MRSEIPGGGDLRDVIELVEGAGQLLLSHPAGSLNIEHKGFRDLVTDADLASEKYILEGIGRLFPGDSILAEESGPVVSHGSRCWIIDPLDGTTNYSHRHPFYCVSAGLVDDEGPVAAVTHSPVLGQSWYAIRNGGSWQRDCSLDVHTQLRMESCQQLKNALLATGFSYQRNELEHGALEVFGSLLKTAREIRRGGSACLDLAFTAAGIFQGFWEFHLAPHDVAAGCLLVREAGGIVTDSAGRDDWLHGGSIVAAAADLHPLLLDSVRSATPPQTPEQRDGR